MRALVQRVVEASVVVDEDVVGQCSEGLLVFVCAMYGDTASSAAALAGKVARLRIFRDDAGKMNRSVLDIEGSALVISQFTLAADTSRGNRPSYATAAPPEAAEGLYLHFAQCLRDLGVPVETGVFGAYMQVRLINDGPVTVWLEN